MLAANDKILKHICIQKSSIFITIKADPIRTLVRAPQYGQCHFDLIFLEMPSTHATQNVFQF